MNQVTQEFIRNGGYRELQEILKVSPYRDHRRIKLNASRGELEQEITRINKILDNNS